MMSFAHEMSCECTKSELDLFSVPPTQTSMEQGSWVEYHPMTTVADGSAIEFDISKTGEDYVDFASTMLLVKAKVTALDGTNLPADAAFGPVNLFLHSLYSQVDTLLNGTLITASTNTYPYRAMMETLLSYGEDARLRDLRLHCTTRTNPAEWIPWILRTMPATVVWPNVVRLRDRVTCLT